MLNAESVIATLELECSPVLSALEDVLAQADVELFLDVGFGKFLGESEDIGFTKGADFHDNLVVHLVGERLGEQGLRPEIKVEFFLGVEGALHLEWRAYFKYRTPEGVGLGG